MKMNKIKQYSMLLYMVAFLSVLVLLLVIKGNEGVEKYQARSEADCETIEHKSLVITEKAGTPLGIEKVYSLRLPDTVQGDMTFAFYFVHQYVTVYLEEELVYSIHPSSEKRIMKTLGCDWVFIPLTQKDAGKSIRVEIDPVYKATVNREPEFLIGSRISIYSKQAENDKWQIFMSIVSIIIGTVFLGIGIYYIVTRKQKADLIALGSFSFMLGIWRLADTRFSPILFSGNATLLFYLSVAMLLLGTLPLLKMLEFNTYKGEYPIIDVLCSISSTFCIILVLLQALSIVDIRQALTLIHIAILLCVVIAAGWILYDYIKYRNTDKGDVLWICVVGVVLDVFAFYMKGNSSGLIFTLSAFQICILCSGIFSVREIITQERIISRQQAELAESRISIMLSQIQPHFLYNSLNSIYYLCGKNPEEARRAIKDFADYLRGNMDSLKLKNPVAFEMELKHIEIYLSLEKMRYDEELKIEYDIQVTNFRIPSLTVQPLVENAVKHGVGKSPEGGTVTIRTREHKDCFEVSVMDDGVGYDSSQNQDDERTHIGISNVRSRLWEMSRATLEIVSIQGQGTTATIQIPKEAKENEDANHSCR